MYIQIIIFSIKLKLTSKSSLDFFHVAGQRVEAGFPVLMLQDQVFQAVEVTRNMARDTLMQLAFENFQSLEEIRRLFGKYTGCIFGILCKGNEYRFNFICESLFRKAQNFFEFYSDLAYIWNKTLKPPLYLKNTNITQSYSLYLYIRLHLIHITHKNILNQHIKSLIT